MKTLSKSKPTRTALLLAALALVAALAIAGCGGGSGTSSVESRSGYGGGGGSTTGDVTAAPNPEEGATFVSVASVPKLGQVIVDSAGHTLYEFDKDKGTTSSCYGACAEGWPPLVTEGEPHASNGADAGMLGTTMRKDGSEQVTYNGRPLYTFVGDKSPGEANGNNVDAFGAEWYALTPSGSQPHGGGQSETPPPPSTY